MEKQLVGWREWLVLTGLGDTAVRAKLDTGARTSALHVLEWTVFTDGGAPWVRFHLDPPRRGGDVGPMFHAPVADQRPVRSSSGQQDDRVMIMTGLRMGSAAWEAEVSLTRRDDMRYALLVGRSALSPRFVVDPAQSYLLGRRRPGGTA